MKCANCDRHTDRFEFRLFDERGDGSLAYGLCSASCVTEFAWKLRESEPKLSKSKQ